MLTSAGSSSHKQDKTNHQFHSEPTFDGKQTISKGASPPSSLLLSSPQSQHHPRKPDEPMPPFNNQILKHLLFPSSSMIHYPENLLSG